MNGPDGDPAPADRGPDDDPGWRDALRFGLWALLPGGGRFATGRIGDGIDGLALLRGLYVAAGVAVLLPGLIVWLLVPGRDDVTGPGGWVVLVPTLGIVALAVGAVARRRPLDARSDAHLVRSFRGPILVSVGAAQVGVVAGFVIALVTGVAWPYLVGLASALPAYLTAAPTRGMVAARQRQLDRQGHDRSLAGALRRSTEAER